MIERSTDATRDIDQRSLATWGASRRALSSEKEVEPQWRPSMVHVVVSEPDLQALLGSWLTSAGLHVTLYKNLGAFLSTVRDGGPNCLLIDAHTPTIGGFEALAVLLPLTIRCPMLVVTPQRHVRMAVSDLRSDTVAVIEKPLDEQAVLRAVGAALQKDRSQRLMELGLAQVHARFATLSPREQQVMRLVTTGMLNKQIGVDLGVSEITVKAHRGAAMRKMQANSLAQLVRMADAIEKNPMPVKSVRSRPAQIVAGEDPHSGCIRAR